MRIFILCILISIVSVFSLYIPKIIEMEKVILGLYFYSFKEYVYVDDDFKIRYDKIKLSEYLKSLGYVIEFLEGDLNFNIYINGFFKYKKTYSFRLISNDEFK